MSDNMKDVYGKAKDNYSFKIKLKSGILVVWFNPYYHMSASYLYPCYQRNTFTYGYSKRTQLYSK